MFEEPELPDFDSMSQAELIEWLEELAKIQGLAASEFIDDGAAAAGQGEPENAEETWSAWLDDTQSATAAKPAEPAEQADGSLGDNFADAEEETPADLARFEVRDSGPLDAEAMAWLAEIGAAEAEEKLPDITDYRPPEPPPENLDELLESGAREDPLEWLDSLSKKSAGPRLPTPAENEPQDAVEAGSDFDDAYEDDETLDDLEDESLYTRRPDASATTLESIMGLQDRESEEYSTQSMAPVPENARQPATDDSSALQAEPVPPEPAPSSVDGLTQAFMLNDQRVDLEAWYISRLREIAAPGDGGGPQPAAKPTLTPVAPPSKPPPPGLAAAINSARGKVQGDQLREALADYETLLRTSAGLEWVISDMRGLIARDQYRHNPSVHRVLGDALMRQGQLDAALDVYRHALALL